MKPQPTDYVERVYAGVLGKIIGVYLGRPFEGWPYARIMQELGEINYYVHERLGVPLIVTDDDISGTFTFLRALPDYGNTATLTPAQIGRTWLNYLIEERTILWWGGMGNSTEHTAYLRLKHGIEAPRSGSAGLNGKVVAEQIGAQIFIDGWAMVAPGDPALAADLARRAASVSHDGEAIYGAQVLAAMESLAFVEPDIHTLLDTAVTFIPKDSVIYRMIADIREWRATIPDWRTAFGRLAEYYGYDKYGGNCHIVPNHGLIVLSLLWGDDDFQKTLMIVNTCGWDTDCNSGNVGCLMGIKNGLAGLDAGPDYRGPVADRLYLPTADGGRAITDAVTETYRIVNIGRALAGEAPLAPKDGARFHFDLPGAVQGWLPEDSRESQGTLTLENVAGHSLKGGRSLALRYRGVATGRPARAATATFIPPEAAAMPGYGLLASPTLYAGQTVRARLAADEHNGAPVICSLYVRSYGDANRLERTAGPHSPLTPGEAHEFTWRLPDMGGNPIAEIGVEISSAKRADGVVYLDYLTWDGAPDVTLARPGHTGTIWQRAWVNGVDQLLHWGETYRLVQNEGVGLLIQGTREWSDYRVSADVMPHLAKSAGIAARVQGMRRYYALLVCFEGEPASSKLRLVKALHDTLPLAEMDFPWNFGETHILTLEVNGPTLRAWVDDRLCFTVTDEDHPLMSGAVALVCEEGRTATNVVRVQGV
ncbi:MAG TPA: ADP-ribosylglycohydrolase family protein [Anaerolineae bacterium]|nr:ADP-ribosylglycohydrolase family protein [Anaerolineae bacterium]HQK12877.1 ADP-ribosylglycohydrolase family protein [Anaerolineae bacterium]